MPTVEELLFLPPIARAAVNVVADLVAQEVAKSHTSQKLEIVRARQAHFIKWNLSKHMDDPVGPEPDRKCFSQFT